MPRGESRRAGKGFGPSNLTEHAGAFRLAANFVVLHRGKLAGTLDRGRESWNL